MTKYQTMVFKHSVKKDLQRVVNTLKAKREDKSRYNFPSENKLPDYIAKNPWY